MLDYLLGGCWFAVCEIRQFDYPFSLY